MGSPATGPPCYNSHIKGYDKQRKEREKKYKSLSIYLKSKRRHEASDVELLIIQLLKKPLGIGNTTPPRVALSISHGMWGKHELR